MMVETPFALQYIFADEVYLLPQDKALFNNPINEPNEPDTVEIAQTPEVTFNYMGGYHQKFLVIVHYPGHETMDPAHLSALESTIKRKELSLDDIALLNLHRYTDSEFEALIAFFAPQKMLILGNSAVPRGLAVPPLNQLTNIDGCGTLYTFAFNEMMGNKDNTKAFWEQMKVL